MPKTCEPRMNEFDKYMTCWGLIADGEPLMTHSSKLLPVRYKSIPSMLKIAISEEERRGAHLMTWWNGRGAAPIWAHDGDALLMERAVCKRSLTQMAKKGNDDEASRIICSVASKLHALENKELSIELVSLPYWFRALDVVAPQHGALLRQAAETAHELFKKPQECVVLHGDIHHENILDFGARGWLAIDPKGLLGERAFDFANIFCNPDFDLATKPDRLEQQATIVAEGAGLDRTRLMKWIFAYAGLSAAWHLEDGSSPELALLVAELASGSLSN